MGSLVAQCINFKNIQSCFYDSNNTSTVICSSNDAREKINSIRGIDSSTCQLEINVVETVLL